MSQPTADVSQRDLPSLLVARLLVLAAAVLWSTSGFFAKAPVIEAWPGPVKAFWRAAFACVVLFPLVRKPQWTWRLLPAVATFALMNFTYLSAMTKGSAANAIWLQCTAPAWVLIVGVLVFRERAVGKDWLLLAFVLAGVGLILWYESQAESLEAFFYGLASGVFYAGVVLSLRQLRDLESAWIVALNHLVTAIVLAPFLFDWSGGSPAAGPHWPSGTTWLFLAGFGILQMGLPYVLFARSLKTIPGHEASGIGLVEPLLVPLWVWLTWGEQPAWWTLAGGGLIFAGLVLRYVGSSPKATAVAPSA
jgi:drug/metabolite transporter (DMT)-like permease